MGIMITYGSYVKKDVNLNKSISLIELMDTGVALLAGVMISTGTKKVKIPKNFHFFFIS